MINKLISSICLYFGLRATSQQVSHFEDKLCCVCLLRLDKARVDERRVLACGHEFHKACVNKWFDLCQKTCPVCRFSVEVEEVEAKKWEELSEEMVIWFSSFHIAGYI
ncbi:E3 ubiquitin protein ligase RHA2A [Tanacetum coccineum]